MEALIVWRGPRVLAAFIKLGAVIVSQGGGGFVDELPPDAAAELGSNNACDTEAAIASEKNVGQLLPMKQVFSYQQ